MGKILFRAEPMLEVLGEPGTRLGPAGGMAADHGRGEGQHTGNGGVHSRLVGQAPGQRREWRQEPPRPNAAQHQEGEARERQQREHEWEDHEIRGVEDRGDGDREQIDHHGEGR